MAKTIGIMSLKGGVGKTSTTVALGDALANLGKKVLLVDANFSTPSLGLHFNIINPEKTIHDVINRTINIAEAIINVGNMDVLPASLFYDRAFNPMSLRNKLRAVNKKYDFILIDSSPSLNDETLAAMLASDSLFVVTTPDVPTLSMTLKAIKIARQRGTKIDGLILNKVHNKNFELSLEDIEKTAEIPILAVIPHDVGFLKALSENVPFTSRKPNSKGSIEFMKLAGVLSGIKFRTYSIKELVNLVTPSRQEINRELYYHRVFED